MRISRIATRGHLTVGAFSMLLAASGAAQAQTTMKPGLWETRVIQMTVDGKDMAAQMNAAQEQMRQALASMPPEQRKKMESMFSSQGAGGMTHRICISPEMASRDSAVVPRQQRAECGDPKITKSGNRSSFEVMCKHADGSQTVSKGETQFAGDQMNTKVETVSTEKGGARRTSKTETQMKFLSSDCGSVKPVEQMMEDLKSQKGAAPGRK
ncbi:DUF3617 family protein [Ottowia caeni]|uniref:DUF3617 family protein n=1 Tax=Ottowia caeni TaxID=2870339 RepID=UPI003D71378D